MATKNTYYAELPKEYLDQILNYEGGYTEDKNDVGNQIKDASGKIIGYSATCRGITQSALDTAKKQGIVGQGVTIKSLLTDLESVRKIYSKNYYLKAKCDRLPHPLAFAHFDMAVNSGVGGRSSRGVALGAGANLQKTIAALGQKITIDGSVGPMTLAALDKVLETVSAKDVAAKYNDLREAYYHSIVRSRPANQKYLNGWLRRLNNVRKVCSK